MKLPALILAAVLALASTALADTVYLLDGSTREGRVIEVTEKEVKLEITHGKSAGIVTIPRENVAKISYSELDPLQIRRKGYDLLASGVPDEAIAAFERLVELAPESAGAHADLGLALTLARRFPEAINAYSKACELEPGQPGFLVSLGYACLKIGDYESARKHLRLFVKKRPKDAAGYRLLGEVCLEEEEYEKALENARKAVLADEKDASSKILLARVYSKLDRLGEALKEATAAILTAPELGEPYLLRAEILFRSGKNEKALADLKKAVELNPNLAERAADIAAERKAKEEKQEPREGQAGQAQPEPPGPKETEKPAGKGKAAREKVAQDVADIEAEMEKVRQLLNEALRRLEELRANQEKLKKSLRK